MNRRLHRNPNVVSRGRLTRWLPAAIEGAVSLSILTAAVVLLVRVRGANVTVVIAFVLLLALASIFGVAAVWGVRRILQISA